MFDWEVPINHKWWKRLAKVWALRDSVHVLTTRIYFTHMALQLFSSEFLIYSLQCWFLLTKHNICMTPQVMPDVCCLIPDAWILMHDAYQPLGQFHLILFYFVDDRRKQSITKVSESIGEGHGKFDFVQKKVFFCECFSY